MFMRGTHFFGFVELFFRCGNIANQTLGEQRIAEVRQLILPADFVASFRGIAKFGCVHQFDVLFVLPAGTRRYFIKPLTEVMAGNAAESGEGVEEWCGPRYSM